MHLLLVEDDNRLSDYVKQALAGEGYTVDICTSIEETQTYMSTQSETPGIVILDRMLGRQDAAALIPILKSRYPDVGILILSALDMPSEKARVIDSGADEYLSKPFSLEELSARLRLVARRVQSGPKAEVTVRKLGNLCLEPKPLITE
jgi:DNA-binding response OmpR family regulator